MKQLQVGHNVLRCVGAISIVIAAAFGVHAQTTKSREPMAIAGANVERFWVARLQLGSGVEIPEMVLALHQDDDVIWGMMIIWHSDFPVTGTLKGNEIMLWIGIPGDTFGIDDLGDTLELKGEVKGDAMEGSASLAVRKDKGRWSAKRYEPPPYRPQ
jgi:hypothetical protein